ncbi:MAG: hypothetical protein ACKVT1_13780 [Dehalococcoidia bacterium]
MDDTGFDCPDCNASYASSDNYCRQCGMYVAALRTGTALAARPAYALEAARPGLPAPVRKAATAVAIGAALQVGLGLASRYFAAQAGQKAARAAITAPQGRGKRGKELARRDDGPPEGIAALSETVLIRRVWIRGDKK